MTSYGSVWRIVRWPGAFVTALLVFSFIYCVTPDVRRPAARRVSAGAVTGVALWLAASAAFSTYLANFKSFNVTYGTFAAAIILLVWLWLTNVALLFGAEITAELVRTKQPGSAKSTLAAFVGRIYYCPRHTGLRFCKYACTPSAKSALP